MHLFTNYFSCFTQFWRIVFPSFVSLALQLYLLNNLFFSLSSHSLLNKRNFNEKTLNFLDLKKRRNSQGVPLLVDYEIRRIMHVRWKKGVYLLWSNCGALLKRNSWGIPLSVDQQEDYPFSVDKRSLPFVEYKRKAEWIFWLGHFENFDKGEKYFPLNAMQIKNNI